MATIYAKNKTTGKWEKVGPAANATDSTLTLQGSPADAKATGDAINNKQNKLTGTSGQIVGFDSEGNAVAKDMQKNIETEGDGAAYTATVEGITALTAGVSFIMIPHTVSTATTPTLNVNSLGAKQLRRRLSNMATSLEAGYSASWLASGKPFRVKYDGTYWVVEDMPKPAAADLYGTLAINKGGTGATTAEAALTKLGAAAAEHTHDGADIILTSPNGTQYRLSVDDNGTLSAVPV